MDGYGASGSPLVVGRFRVRPRRRYVSNLGARQQLTGVTSITSRRSTRYRCLFHPSWRRGSQRLPTGSKPPFGTGAFPSFRRPRKGAPLPGSPAGEGGQHVELGAASDRCLPIPDRHRVEQETATLEHPAQRLPVPPHRRIQGIADRGTLPELDLLTGRARSGTGTREVTYGHHGQRNSITDRIRGHLTHITAVTHPIDPLQAGKGEERRG